MARVIYEGTGSGSIKVGFYTNDARYKSVAAGLGLKKVKQATEGVRPGKGVAGALVKVRANLENGKSVILNCSPDKVSSVAKSIKGKAVNGSKVRSVSFPQ